MYSSDFVPVGTTVHLQEKVHKLYGPKYLGDLTMIDSNVWSGKHYQCLVKNKSGSKLRIKKTNLIIGPVISSVIDKKVEKNTNYVITCDSDPNYYDEPENCKLIKNTTEANAITKAQDYLTEYNDDDKDIETVYVYKLIKKITFKKNFNVEDV